MHNQNSVTISLLALAALAVSIHAQKPAGVPNARADASTSAAFQASQPWQRFVETAGGQWTMQWCAATGTPSAIWGTGLPLADWRENTLVEARRHANQLLREQSELLGLRTSEFREIIGSRMGRTWSFVYDQFFGGLPVIGGRADVRVHMAGRIPMFGSMAWPIAADFGTTPSFTAEVAIAAAWQALGQNPTGVVQPARVAAPRLVIWGDVQALQQAPHFLAWEVAVSNVDLTGNGTIGRYYLDARTGAVLHFANDKHECGFAGCVLGNHAHGNHAANPVVGPERKLPLAAPINTTVTVMGWTRTGIDAFSGLVNVPQAGLVLNVPGIGNVTTDNNGQFVINIAAPVSISVGALDGRHHAVIAGANAPSGSTTVNPGVATTIQVLTAAATGNQAAHTTTSWFTDRVNEYSRSILGNSAELNAADNVGVTVNIASTCNAYYTGNTINFYQAGGGCSNTSFSTVVAHEWGHGIDDRYGGISQTNGLSEGWGDTFGCYLLDTPLLGSGFQTAGVALRNANNTTQYPGGSGVHGMGQSWMGFAWKLRDRLALTLGNRPAAIALTDDIVISTIAADATNQQDAVREVFIADDNDGNLSNGTPHYADLVWACNQHSLPYPPLTSPSNDDCLTPINLSNGLNGPFTNVLATASAPAWPCGSGTADVWFTYVAGFAGTLTVDTCGQAAFDTQVQIFSGTCGALTNLGCNDNSCGLQSSLSVAVTTGVYRIRVGGPLAQTGTFSVNVSGPAGYLASTATYGTGCYRTSKAFYELWSAGAFDLSGSSMQLVRNGNYYVAQPGGSYLAPTGAATVLTLSDDSFTSVALASPFPFPGGTTSSFEVCSNGFVSVATGNGASYTPDAAPWLGSPQTRWGTWHDFNSAPVGSGQIKFEQIGNISYVTWDGVYSYATTVPNTWQLQFDRSTGNVTYVWQNIATAGNGWLVGFAAQAPNSDLGSRDISATLPGTFRTSADNAEAMALTGTLPVIGTTVTLTATNYPPTSTLGIQALSFVRQDPGIDLTSVGMPGCFRFTNLEVTLFVPPVAMQSIHLLSIPNNTTLQGLPVASQTWALAIGANPLGLITSNGVAMIVGL